VTSKRISLIVATYNRAGPLDRLLTHVQGQTLAHDAFEVVVCVDGSKDRTGEVLEGWKQRAGFSLVTLAQENRGQSVARHRAIERASAQRVAIVDDDMELCPEFLAAHLECAQANPERALVIGKVMPEERWREKPLYEAVRDDAMQRLHQRLESGEQVPSATAFVGNVSAPRQLYLDVGGFDASLRLAEDRELGMRLERAGGQLCFAPAAWVIHHSDIGSYEIWERREYEYGKYAVQVWEKNQRDPYFHPVRNFVNGNPANRAAVKILSRWDVTAKQGSRLLRTVGNVLQRMGWIDPALATHKAILSVQYHLGVKHALGSWDALQESANQFRADPQRPDQPTGRGATRH